jgi:hypothetical protein
MNSKQPFGTRNFASGRWGQCGEQSLEEENKELKSQIAEDKKIIDNLRNKINTALTYISKETS